MPMILVVEDEYAIAALVLDLLQEEGYAVALATNGIEGLAQAQRVHPDLIITDLMMPGMDGIRMCQTLQATPTFRTTPIVLMSAGTTKSIDQCDFVAFLHKPFEITALLDTVEQSLQP